MAKNTKSKKKKDVKKVSKASSSFPKEKWYAVFIFVLAVVLYSNTFNHGFVLDDDLVLAKNPHVVQGKIVDIFTSSYHQAFSGKPDKNYRPMSMAVFAIENNIAGKTENGILKASSFHVFNVLWYALACAILYLFLFKVFKKKTPWLALGISLLFVAHPIHTEVVANIKSRDEIFVFLGMIITLYTLLKFSETKNKIWLISSISAYLFACLSKESGLPIIGLAPLTLYFFTSLDREKIFKTSSFYLVTVVLFFLLRMSFTGDNGNELGAIDNILIPENVGLLEKISTALGMIWDYLVLLVFPHPLSYDYSAYQVPIMNLSDWKVWTGLLSIVGLFYACFRLSKSKSPIAYAIGLSAIMFVLVSNLFFSIGVTMAERLLFSPSLGFCIILGYLAYEYLYKKNNDILYWVAIIGIFALYSLKTFERNKVWESNETLHASGLITAPNSSRANSFYGHRLYEKAMVATDPVSKQALANEAIIYFNKATDILPSFRDAHHNKGLCYEILKQYDNAIASYDAAIALDNDYHLTICAKGLAYHSKGDIINAHQYIKQAYDIAPGNQTMIQNYNFILYKIRDLYRSQNKMEKAISYDQEIKRLEGQ